MLGICMLPLSTMIFKFRGLKPFVIQFRQDIIIIMVEMNYNSRHSTILSVSTFLYSWWSVFTSNWFEWSIYVATIPNYSYIYSFILRLKDIATAQKSIIIGERTRGRVSCSPLEIMHCQHFARGFCRCTGVSTARDKQTLLFNIYKL